MAITWYREHKRGDLTNREKTTEDAIQGFLFENDSQVVIKNSNRVDRFDGVARMEVVVARAIPVNS